MYTKNNLQNKITIIFFTLLVFVQIAMLVSLAMGIVSLERFCSYAIMILGLGLTAVSFLENRRVGVRDIFLFLMVWFLCFLGVYKEWRYENIVSALCFLLMVSIWRGSKTVEDNKYNTKMLCVSYITQGAILIVLSFTPYAYESYQNYVLVSEELTLGFANPNQTGIVLFSTVAGLLLMQQKKVVNRFWNFVILAEAVMLSALLWKTNARTSIISIVVFAFFFIFTSKRSIKKKKVFLADLVMCFPVVFVFGYLWLAEGRFKDIVIQNKRLFSGREDVYRQVLESWSDKVLGNLEWFNFQNAHNSHLTILVNIGIVGFLIYMIYSLESFNNFYRKCENRQQVLCVIAILCLFIMGCAETAVLTGGTIYYVYMLTFVVLGNNTSS